MATRKKRRLAPQARERAKILRKHPTDAEALLWQLLRRRQMDGVRFRRQHPIGSYIADFYCHQARLVIEVDGGHHGQGQLVYDVQRTTHLEEQGLHVVRFWNGEVLSATESVLRSIRQIVASRLSSL